VWKFVQVITFSHSFIALSKKCPFSFENQLYLFILLTNLEEETIQYFYESFFSIAATTFTKWSTKEMKSQLKFRMILKKTTNKLYPFGGYHVDSSNGNSSNDDLTNGISSNVVLPTLSVRLMSVCLLCQFT